MQEMSVNERVAALRAQPEAVTGTVRVRLDDLVYGAGPDEFLDKVAEEVTGIDVADLSDDWQVAYQVVGHEPENTLVLEVTVLP